MYMRVHEIYTLQLIGNKFYNRFKMYCMRRIDPKMLIVVAVPVLLILAGIISFAYGLCAG